VTVEGIETNAQADFVEASGGHQMQGYLISRPVPSDMVTALFSPKPQSPSIQPTQQPEQGRLRDGTDTLSRGLLQSFET
jgi:predicted signal transduction protein with EAL and GGDEF domain